MAHKICLFFVAAAFAAAIGFVMHVFTVELIHGWVAVQMAGKTVHTSWDVRIPAALSSLEMGLGLALLYALVRCRFPTLSWWVGGLVLGGLTLALKGHLVRQPLMNWLVGNPVEVVLVQDGAVWLTWLVMSMIVALVFQVGVGVTSAAREDLKAENL